MREPEPASLFEATVLAAFFLTISPTLLPPLSFPSLPPLSLCWYSPPNLAVAPPTLIFLHLAFGLSLSLPCRARFRARLPPSNPSPFCSITRPASATSPAISSPAPPPRRAAATGLICACIIIIDDMHSISVALALEHVLDLVLNIALNL